MTDTTLGAVVDRSAVFAQLKRRRRLVRALRVAVPAIGLVALAALAGQIYFASVGGGFSAGGIRLDRDRLVVERPTISGALAGNGRYELTADTAEAPIANATSADLTAIEMLLLFEDGGSARAVADSGVIHFGPRQLVTEDIVTLTSSRGDTGRLAGAVIDVVEQQFSNTGGVDFTFADGATLNADAMQYEATRGIWRFEGVTLRFRPPPLAASPEVAP